MRIWEVRELKFHWTFFLFPVNPTFFLGVFRSGRSFAFHIGWFVKGSCYANFSDKNFSDQREAGTIFFDETQFAEPKAPVATFAYWNDKNDCPGWGTAKEEDLH